MICIVCVYYTLSTLVIIVTVVRTVFLLLQMRQSTPLHIAAQNGHVESSRQLIDAGANVNAVEEVSIVCYIAHEGLTCMYK